MSVATAADGNATVRIPCPWTKNVVEISVPPRYDSSEFCPECDYPLFWTKEAHDATKAHEASLAAAERDAVIEAQASKAEAERAIAELAIAKRVREDREWFDAPESGTTARQRSTWYWPAALASVLLVLLIAVLIAVVVSMFG